MQLLSRVCNCEMDSQKRLHVLMSHVHTYDNSIFFKITSKLENTHISESSLLIKLWFVFPAIQTWLCYKMRCCFRYE